MHLKRGTVPTIFPWQNEEILKLEILDTETDKSSGSTNKLNNLTEAEQSENVMLFKLEICYVYLI